MIPFAEFAPDRANIDPDASDGIKNCLPGAKTWTPVKSLEPISNALPEVARGGILGRGDGYVVFAGTSDKLWQLSAGTWQDLSGGTYGLPPTDQWQFLQFGDDIFATNIADGLQTVNIGLGGNFSTVAGAPQAQYMWRAAGFVVLAGISGHQHKRVQWSGLEKPTTWTPGQDLSDFQDLPISGQILGGTGDETGAVIATSVGFWRMTFIPGSRAVFRFDEINPSSGKGDEPAGIVAPASLTQYGPRIFYLSENGFAELGTPPRYIGNERVDEFFLADVDLDYLELVQGTSDATQKLIAWRYRSSAASLPDITDKVLVYNILLDRWAVFEQHLELMINATTPGYTMDELGDVLGYTLVDDVPGILDSRAWKGGRPTFSGFDELHQLGTFTGNPKEATLETSDVALGGEARSAFVNGFRPIVDTDGVFGQVATKKTHGEQRVWNSEAAQNVTGHIPARSDGRLHRFRIRIPSGVDWKHASGIETPEVLRRTGRR